jgi:hypothetical protein
MSFRTCRLGTSISGCFSRLKSFSACRTPSANFHPGGGIEVRSPGIPLCSCCMLCGHCNEALEGLHARSAAKTGLLVLEHR